VRIAAGDVEIQASDDSSVSLRRLTTTEAPFRLDAPGVTVRIDESVSALGVANWQDNRWALPHDVEVSGTTLVVSAGDDAPRAFSVVSVTPHSVAMGAQVSDFRELLGLKRNRRIPEAVYFNAKTQLRP
jgi:hypothetical protein